MSNVFEWFCLAQAYHDVFKEKLEYFLNHGHEVDLHVDFDNSNDEDLILIVEYHHNGYRVGCTLHVQSQADLALVREVFEDLQILIWHWEESFVNSQFEHKYEDMLQDRDD